jgi:Flp pilus assembly protein TadD
LRAAVKQKNEDFKGAEADYSKVIELQPKNPHAYAKRAIIRIHLKDIEGGNKDMEMSDKLMEETGDNKKK